MHCIRLDADAPLISKQARFRGNFIKVKGLLQGRLPILKCNMHTVIDQKHLMRMMNFTSPSGSFYSHLETHVQNLDNMIVV